MTWAALRVLFVKNLKLKLRSPFSTLLELAMPILLASLLVYSRSKVPDVEIPDIGYLGRVSQLGRFTGPVGAAPLEACQAWLATLPPQDARFVRCFQDEATVEIAAETGDLQAVGAVVIFEKQGSFHFRFSDPNDEQLLHAQYLLGATRAAAEGEAEALSVRMHDPMRESPVISVFQQGAEAAVGLLMVMVSQSVSKFVNAVASEKENKLKELLLIHGLTETTLYLSWLATAGFLHAVLAGTVTGIFAFGNLFRHSSYLQVFLLLWSFGVSSVLLALAVSAPFRSTKIASVFSMVFYFVVSLVRNIRLAKNALLLHLLPQVAFDRGVHILVAREVSPTAAGSVGLEIFLLLVSSSVFFALWVGLDSGSFAFLTQMLGRAKRDSSYVPLSPVELGRATETPDEEGCVSEPLDERRRTEAMLGECVTVKRVSVSYGDLRAVDQLSFSIFRSQVSVLLAPNGGGKSSLLKCLCGLVSQSWRGEISVFGEERLQSRRRLLGFCPQEDVLWPELTVGEHLDIFAGIKRTSEARTLLVESGMMGKKNARVAELSGGMKRKLNALIAFGGNFVMLDEPTTGLDPVSRRATHEMIGKLKQGRVILLTTHFMDEAELLGERILIMAAGRLRAAGSLGFLKRQFDCGHVLTFAGSRDGAAIPMGEFLGRAKKQQLLPEGASVKLKTHDSLTLRVLQAEKIPEIIELARMYFNTTSVDTARLEEIFMHIAKPGGFASGTGALEGTSKKREQRALPSEAEISASIDRPRQLKAELRRRGLGVRRDFRSIVCMQLAPLLVVAAGVWLGSAMSGERHAEISGGHLRLGTVGEVSGDKFPIKNFRSVQPVKDVTLQCASDDQSCQLEIAMAGNFCLQNRSRCEAWVQISRYLAETQDAGRDSDFDAVVFGEGNSVSLFSRRSPEFVKNELVAGIFGQEFEMRSLPLPSEMAKIASLAQNVAPAIYAIIGLSFFSAGAAMGVVKERSLKIHVVVSGLTPVAYWLARLAADVAMYVPVAIVTWLLLRSSPTFDKKELALLALSYGPAALGNAYVVSFWFSDGPAAQNFSLTLSQVSGFMLVMVHRGLKIFYPSFPLFPLAVALSPAFLLGDGLLTLVMNHYFATEEDVMAHVGLLVLYAVLAVSLVFAYEQSRGDFVRKAKTFLRVRRQQQEYAELEEMRPRSSSFRGEEALVVSELTRRYGNKVAVNNVSLGCRVGEVYGLLGVNGAGKTTLIRVCTGQIAGDHGRVLVANMETSKAGKIVGYCAQEDVFSEDLTVLENLQVMAAIKNVKDETLATQLVEALDLRHFWDKRSGDLSGGNKRKLCVGMALIGNPVVVFLDEPSSGMDPVARRFLWGVIKKASEEAAVVLTTHLMEEAEALSDCIGVMKNGNIIAEGSMEVLRKALPTGWEVKLRLPSSSPLRSEIPEQIRAELESRLGVSVSSGLSRGETAGELKLQVASGVSEISSLFTALEELKTSFGISEYFVAQLTLEAVFNQLVQDESSPPSL